MQAVSGGSSISFLYPVLYSLHQSLWSRFHWLLYVPVCLKCSIIQFIFIFYLLWLGCALNVFYMCFFSPRDGESIAGHILLGRCHHETLLSWWPTKSSSHSCRSHAIISRLWLNQLFFFSKATQFGLTIYRIIEFFVGKILAEIERGKVNLINIYCYSNHSRWERELIHTRSNKELT